METELTKTMKNSVVFFKPDMPTQLRTIRYATEVWTPTGIVDAIRFEDYKEKDNSFCTLLNLEKHSKEYQDALRITNAEQIGKCKIEGQNYPNKNCTGCFWHSHAYDIGMCITCYECKISLSDFKSPNGHNFHGNKNYYVVPKSLVKKIENLVPDNIGIIVFYENSGSFRIAKECTFNTVPDEIKIKLLYNALGKWCKKGV